MAKGREPLETEKEEIREIVQEEVKAAIKTTRKTTPKKSGRTQAGGKKQKISFSKKLTLFISGIWTFLVVFCLVFWIIDRDYPSEIFNAVTVPFVTILTSYFVKSGVENKSKIEGDGDDDSQVY